MTSDIAKAACRAAAPEQVTPAVTRFDVRSRQPAGSVEPRVVGSRIDDPEGRATAPGGGPLGRDLSAVPVFGPAFVPARPTPAPGGRTSSRTPEGAPAGQDTAERQAEGMGTRIGRFLGDVPVVAGRLSRAVRAVAEPLLGRSLEDVELDVGSEATALASGEHALAVTRGTRVAFAAGAFRPDSGPGRALIGHELTHAVQQRAHGVSRPQRFAAVLDYEKLARQIRSAVSGPGTDEEAIYRALTQLHREPGAIALLESTYLRLYGDPLLKDLRGDLDDQEFDYAKGLLGKPVAPASKQLIDPTVPAGPAAWDALARRLKAAADYQTWGFLGGTDEEAIFAVLAPLSGDPAKIAEIKAAYARIVGGRSTALVDMLRSELSGSELSYALELVAVPDPHAGTQSELSRDQVLAVRNELAPGTKVAPPAPPPVGGPAPPLPAAHLWDGRAGAPGFAAKRAALRADLLTDLNNHLTRVMPDITLKAAAPKIPVKALEGAANAAVEVTDDEYRSSYAVSASTPGQAALRSGFVFSEAAGNLRDATSPAARTATGIPISAASVAHWMIRNDDPPAPPGAIEHMEAHNFDPDRDGLGEGAWLQSQVIAPFIAPPRNAQLRQYDQFGFALQPEAGKIVIPTSTPGSSLGTGGAVPNLIDRRSMWATWHIAVHEYLHNLAHPAFQKAIAGPVMNEGFTEFFTKGVLTKVAPVAHLNPGLVHKVEGGTFLPPTTKALVGAYSTPQTYAANLAHVETVARQVPGGVNAVRSAYFQGHVEMLGIDPATHRFEATPPATVDPGLVKVPAGIATLADLADRSGSSESAIRTANPGLPVAGLPPRLRIPGAREHRVAATFVPAGLGPRETDKQIAAQNGVSLAALHKANPAVNWAALALGQRILIPRH